MKNSSRFRLAPSCFALLSVAVAPIARAEFKCDLPQLSRADATACAKATESVASLRQFVSRTRMIYGLQMNDYMRFEDEALKASSAQTAQPVQTSVAELAPPSR